MIVQHLNVKIFAEQGVPDLSPAIPIFHRWIRENTGPEVLVDVADYSHAPAGPGIVLIGHDANYALDCSRGRLGLLYARKTSLEGSTANKLAQAFEAALSACARLESEPEFRDKLSFDRTQVEVVFNDRMLTPNNQETWESLREEMTGFFDGLFGAGGYELARPAEPRERLRLDIRARALPATSPAG
jgi:hypothetical protein